MRGGMGRFGVLLVVAMLFASWPQFTQVRAVPPDARTTKVIVDNGDPAAIQQLMARGATRIEDYGSFSLWRIPAAERTMLAANTSVTPATDFDTIQFRSGSVDTSTPIPPVPANLRQGRTPGQQFWVVQFAGPIKPDWLDELRKDGLEIVSYIPNNAYIVWGDGGAIDALERSVATSPVRQFTGAYHTAYRLAPDLQTTKTPLPENIAVTVQFYKTANVDASVAAVTALAGGTLLKGRQDLLNLVDITLAVPSSALPAIAARADVFNVEPFVEPKKRDERQGEIIAGHVVTNGGNVVPNPPGYLAWLASKGFPQTPASYPLVYVVDDGVDNGTVNPIHPDFRQLGVAANASRIITLSNCTTDALPDAVGGHGNINASIVAGYNNGTGAANEDAGGYQYGLGISPYGRVGNQKIFTNAGPYNVSACGGTDAGVVQASFSAGAQITSNSWGAPVGGAYNASARAYDILTRDASGTTAGNQQILHVFSAGNDGPGLNTVGSPGTGKNVLTVGATENVRDEGVPDGCNTSAANNADDTATFSSRGPTDDGRAKPDITAPGTHIQGAASQAAGYNGTGVCGAAGNSGAAEPADYYPAGQTRYTWSSGTSHSAPAVSGAASLLYNYYGRVLAPGQTPSPAMLKALLLNTPRYLNGAGTGGTLPQTAQGWGDVNLGALFDSAPPIVQDQNQLFTATGQVANYTGTVTDASKPFRVSLVWTDAAGPTTGNAFVNNLDLTVTIGGQTYRGNVFSGANSVTGGAADTKNNVENVFLPAGISGNYTVTVTATNLAAVAVPGGAGSVNQDFALVISSSANDPAAVLAMNTTTINDMMFGNGNGIIEPGEKVAFTPSVRNLGNLAGQNVTVTVTSPTAGVTITDGTKNLGTVAAGASALSPSPVFVELSAAFPCGGTVTLNVQITSSNATASTTPVTRTTGTFVLGVPSGTYTATELPLPIPDNTLAGVNKVIPVSGATGNTGKVTVQLSIPHTWVGDLRLRLTAPNGTTVTLTDRPGGSNNGGDNLTNTVFDDAAATPISGGTVPYTGSFRPQEPLTNLNGSTINGSWTLNVADLVNADIGSLTALSLTVTPGAQVCTYVAQIATISPRSGDANGGSPVVLTGTNFRSDMLVKFGTATATVMSVSPDGTQATVIAPPASGSGKVNVSVQLGTRPAMVLTQAYEYGTASAAPVAPPFAAPMSSTPPSGALPRMAAPTVPGPPPAPAPPRR